MIASILAFPFFTKVLLALCVVVTIIGMIFFYLADLCRSLSHLGTLTHPQIEELYRLFISPFAHASILHLFFNCLFLHQVGPQLERLMGSFRFYCATVYFFIVCIFVEFLCLFLIDQLPIASGRASSSCSLGFSGILFAYLVVHSQLSEYPTYSVYGCFDVPTKYYPLALLILFQLIGSNVSFLGHMAGMVGGYFYLFGYFDALVPFSAKNLELELHLNSLPGWIIETEFKPSYPTQHTSDGSGPWTGTPGSLV